MENATTIYSGIQSPVLDFEIFVYNERRHNDSNSKVKIIETNGFIDVLNIKIMFNDLF